MRSIILYIVRKFLNTIISFKLKRLGTLTAQAESSNILLVNLHGIGDVVMSTPVIDRLKAVNPGFKIDYLMNKPAAALFTADSRLNQVMIFDEKNPWQSVKKVKEKYYAYVFVLLGGIWGNIIGITAGYNGIAGMLVNSPDIVCINCRRLQGKKNIPVKYKLPAHFHLAKAMLEPVDKIFGSPVTSAVNESISYSLQLPDDNKTIISSFTAEVQAFLGRNKTDLVVIAPEANWDLKNIKEDLIFQLADYLVTYNFRVIIIGSREPAVPCTGTGNRDSVLDLRGRTSLLSACNLISFARFVVTADSAFMHISAALKKFTFILFGPTDPRKLKPQNEKTVVLSKKLACSPCYNGVQIPHCINKIHNACMLWKADELKIVFDENAIISTTNR